MSTGKRLAGLLLLTSSLAFPTALYAQTTGEPEDELIDDVQDIDDDREIDQPEVSVPGGGIIVTGRRNRNPERASTQVLNVLSEDDIARTGEGDIAESGQIRNERSRAHATRKSVRADGEGEKAEAGQ